MNRSTPGLRNVDVARTGISEVAPAQGRITYRGIDLEDICENHTYDECAHLLMLGNLPTEHELDTFRRQIDVTAIDSEGVSSVLAACKDLPPIDRLRTGVSALSNRARTTASDWRLQLFGTIFATGERVLADSHLEENLSGELCSIPDKLLFHAMPKFATPSNRLLLDRTFSAVAEHGAANSTFTARVVMSSRPSPEAALCAALASFSGSLHGAAVEHAFSDLQSVADSNDPYQAAENYFKEVRSGTRRPMGFGHPVYRREDPRATILRRILLESAAPDGERFVRAIDLLKEKMSPYQEYGLYVNCDLYCGVVYHLCGFSIDQFSTLHALARTAGWIAHIAEQKRGGLLIRPTFQFDPNL